jgi:hypothetical protein
MFDSLCFFQPSAWHGISYAGGGMNTVPGRDEECSNSKKNSNPQVHAVLKPHYYMLGDKKELWA